MMRILSPVISHNYVVIVDLFRECGVASKLLCYPGQTHPISKPGVTHTKSIGVSVLFLVCFSFSAADSGSLVRSDLEMDFMAECASWFARHGSLPVAAPKL